MPYIVIHPELEPSFLRAINRIFEGVDDTKLKRIQASRWRKCMTPEVQAMVDAARESNTVTKSIKSFVQAAAAQIQGSANLANAQKVAQDMASNSDEIAAAVTENTPSEGEEDEEGGDEEAETGGETVPAA